MKLNFKTLVSLTLVLMWAHHAVAPVDPEWLKKYAVVLDAFDEMRSAIVHRTIESLSNLQNSLSDIHKMNSSLKNVDIALSNFEKTINANKAAFDAFIKNQDVDIFIHATRMYLFEPLFDLNNKIEPIVNAISEEHIKQLSQAFLKQFMEVLRLTKQIFYHDVTAILYDIKLIDEQAGSQLDAMLQEPNFAFFANSNVFNETVEKVEEEIQKRLQRPRH